MLRYTSILFMLITVSAAGQNFNYEARVDPVEKNGFYKMLLTPEITSKLNSQFFDIRLYNNETEIPYIFQTESSVSEKELFIEYDIVKTEHIKHLKYTRIVIRNPYKTSINNIVLRVKNAYVRKLLKLNGSYDKSNWYVLKDNYAYNSISNIENTTEIRVLNFPLSDYEYYELLIDDYFDKPINIIQAGYYNQIKENGKYSELQGISFSINDTLKETIVSIPLNGYYADKIELNIDSPKYFYRKAELFIKKNMVSKKKNVSYVQSIGRFKLISNSNNTFLLNNLRADTLFIKIVNNDNQALSLKEIHVYQLNKYIIAELNAQENYVLRFSDKNANKPNYDLKYFKDSIPEHLKTIRTKTVENIATKDAGAKSENFKLNKLWLWLSIIGVASLLAFMSVKMIRENKD